MLGSTRADFLGIGEVIDRPRSGLVEFDGGADSRAAERVRVGWKRIRDQCELLDGHLRGHRCRRELRELDRPFSHDVAAENAVELSIDDQLAEPGRAAVDDRSRERVEPHRRHDHLVALPGCRFG